MTRELIPTKVIVVGLAIVAGAIAALFAIGARDGVPVAQAAPCAKSTTPASDLPPNAVRRAVKCQIDRLRASRDRKRLSRNAQLQRVAQRHTAVMVKKECIKPRCPGQPSLQQRLNSSGYLDNAKRWRFAMSTGCAVNARQMVREWRKRQFHRKNMLTPRFQHIGVGIKAQAPFPDCGASTSTFSALLAWRVR